MHWKISMMLFASLPCACSDAPAEAPMHTSYLVEAEDLKSMIGRPNIKLLDFRKRADYQTEHLPSAVNIWRSDIEDTSYSYGGMMPSKEHIESLFGKLGISAQDTIVIYDDNGLCNASRLWWILQNYDFDKVKLLHGGIAAWKSNGGKVTDQITEMKAQVFSLTDAPSMKLYLSKEDMQGALEEDHTILDTRSADEFSGKRQKKGAYKGGRIPGSIHIDWADAIYFNESKRIRPIAELDGIYSQLSMAKDAPLLVYCHSGVRSAHTTFVLTQLLGYENVKNYDGSWTEWSYFNDLPFENDSVTTIQ